MLQLPLLLLIVFYCNKTTAAIKPTLIFITKYNKVRYNDLTYIQHLFHSSYLQTFNSLILRTSFLFTS